MRIVLVRARNPLNMGAAARAMANFGFEDLVLVAPYGAGWQRARSARAGAAVLQRARVEADLPAALDGCSFVVGTAAGQGRAPELPLQDWAHVASQMPAAGGALVFGSEKTGLSVEEISHCHHLARLPTRPQAPSMNLGQAVAVCCFDLARRLHPSIPSHPPSAQLAAPQIERLLATWYPLLVRLGAVRPAHCASQTRILRQMLLRWRLTPADERRLLGVARQLRHALPEDLPRA